MCPRGVYQRRQPRQAGAEPAEPTLFDLARQIAEKMGIEQPILNVHLETKTIVIRSGKADLKEHDNG